MSMNTQGAAFDDVLYSLGWWGRYQKIQFWNAMAPILPCALHVMAVVFIGRAMEHQCATPKTFNLPMGDEGQTQVVDALSVINASIPHSNISVTYGSCKITVKNSSEVLTLTKCTNGYDYTEPKDRSFVSEWDLVCEQESLSDFTQLIMSIGMAFGAFSSTALSDMYGRKKLYMLTHSALLVASLATAFVPNFLSFLILRFFLGAMQQGTGLVSNVILIELLPTEKRALPSQIGSVVWPFCLLILGFCGYVTRETSWRHTQILLSVFSLFVLVQWWILEESLRWLIANGKKDEAEAVIRKAAKKNGTSADKALRILDSSLRDNHSAVYRPLKTTDTEDHQGDEQDTSAAEAGLVPSARQDNMSAFIKNKKLFMLTLVLSYAWFTDCLAYYGLIMTSPSLTDNFYLGYTLNILVEVPGAVAFWVLINRIGRKKCMNIFHIIGGVSLLVSTILSTLSITKDLPGMDTVILCVSLLGKFGVSTSFAILFLYTPELFPTKLRNTGFGIASASARFGGMLAPYTRTFARHIPWGPGAVFSILCLLVPLTVKFLPETHGVELPQTLEEFELHFLGASKDSTTKPKNDLNSGLPKK